MAKSLNLTRERDGAVARVTLTRPEVANAFDDVMVADLAAAAAELRDDAAVRAVVLASEGRHFSAGADLGWMRRAADYDRERNVADALELARMLEAWDDLPKPVVGRVQGAALGGGVGLVCVCDVVVASSKARMGLTEVRLGLIPAVISPFVIRKIGTSWARALFLTADRVDAQTALNLGLVHEISEPETLDGAVEATLDALLVAGPEALAAAKLLVRQVNDTPRHDLAALTAGLIADRRDSAEGREGLGAFLEKREPSWRGGGA